MSVFKSYASSFRAALKGSSNWYIAGVMGLICLLIAAMTDGGMAALKYDRLKIEEGEYWRLLTGHFTHLSVAHLNLNLFGLFLVWLLVGRYYSSLQWLLVILFCLLTASAGFWFIDPNILWYVGLSGILHGFLLAGAMQGCRVLPVENAIIFAIVIGKLVYEQVAGPVPGAESGSGGSVVVNAHLFGSVGGILGATILWRSGMINRSI